MRWKTTTTGSKFTVVGAAELPAAGEAGLALTHLLPDVAVQGIRRVWKDWKAPLKVV